MPLRVAVVAALLAAAVGCGEVPVEDSSDEPAPSHDTPTSEDPASDAADPPPAAGTVETFEITDPSHISGTYDYPQTPPAGGPHSPVWQNCGFYVEPIVNENAVHSLEHGAVWITYDPGLAADQVLMLRALAASDPYLLVSPYDGLPSPVVASAWGAQVTLPDASDPALDAFLDEYVQGAQSPEPGAPCTGGTGTPD